MIRNEQVIRAWYCGEPAAAGNLFTDGVKLYSYRLKIGDRSDGLNRIWDYTASGCYYSQTTSCHVGLAVRLTPQVFLMTP
jgi:hypothetical protein